MYLIIGNYIDENIKKKRRLPFSNTAASNRILRLSQALTEAGEEVCILSPATAFSQKWCGTILHKSIYVSDNKEKILYSPSIGIPILSSIFELIIFPYFVFKFLRNNKAKSVIFYCYYGSSVITAVLISLFTKINVTVDIEDISSLNLSDWKPKSGVNPLHQLYGWIMMKIMLKCSNNVILPTKRFSKYIDYKKPFLLIDGCIETPKVFDLNFVNPNEINILFSGKLDEENGLYILLSAICELDKVYSGEVKLVFNICGSCPKEKDITDVRLNSPLIDIKYHGFLSNTDYFLLLKKCQLCIVLQKPDGRFSGGKTPSKGYEFMGHGKALIITDIGDFKNLPNDTRYILDTPYVLNLVNIIKSITKEDIKDIGYNAYIYAKNNWSYKKVGSNIISLNRK